MDGSYLRCCEINFKAPLKGIDPLPTSYRTDDGKYSFKNDNGHWMSILDTYWVQVRSSNYGNLEKFSVENYGPDVGLYMIKGENGYFRCM